jgi:CheY-like chemotaxis protein
MDASAVGSSTLPTSGKRSDAAKRRILVADDNRDSASSLAVFLELMGYEVRAVNDGLEAIDTASLFRPAVMLLDLGMPRLDGYEVCRTVRGQPWGDEVVIIAMTGWGQDEDRRRSRDAGFNHHLVKPVQPAALGKLLEGLDSEPAV